VSTGYYAFCVCDLSIDIEDDCDPCGESESEENCEVCSSQHVGPMFYV